MIDTCEHYCAKVRHRLSRKDGKSSTETERKSHDSGKKRRSKERRSEEYESPPKDEDSKKPPEEIKVPKKRSRSPDKKGGHKCDQKASDSIDSKRFKLEDTDDTADATDHSKAVAETSGSDGKFEAL